MAASESAQKVNARAHCLSAVRCLELAESSAGKLASRLRTIHLLSRQVAYLACGRWQAKMALTSCSVRSHGRPLRGPTQPVRTIRIIHAQHRKQRSSC